MHPSVSATDVHDPQETARTMTDQEPQFRDARPPAIVLTTMNRAVRPLLRSPLHRTLSRSVMVLEMTGRRSGRRIAIPVMRYQRPDGTFVVSAGGRWRHNLRGGADVDVVLEGRRRAAHAVLEEDPQRAAGLFLELLEQAGERALALKFAGEPPRNVEQLQPLLPSLLENRSVALLSLRN